MDAVQEANSGHPGTPMALAPVAYCLWQRFLRFDPEDPIWPNRDRFVLSAGHASMLLYSLLHLTGVKAVNPKYERLGDAVGHARRHQALPPARQQVPGPPRVPLDLGRRDHHRARSARASRRASAWRSPGRWLAAHFNRPGFAMFDYDVYALGGDGCMMEGISSEAASLAGHLKLSNLCWIYDNNHITIEGNTALAFSDDVATRFLGYGWNVTRVGDANDLEHARARVPRRSSDTTRPADADHRRQPHRLRRAATSRTPSAAHGEPLGEEEIRLTKRNYGWPEDAQVPRPRRRARALPPPASARAARGAARGVDGAVRRVQRRSTPSSPTSSCAMQQRELPDGWDEGAPTFPADAKGVATRDSSGKVLNALAPDACRG